MSANTNVQKAYFVLSEKIIAQGFFDPEVDWQGFRLPWFSLDECERLIKILESQNDVKYIFRRNQEGTGYILTDVNDPGAGVAEKLDSSVIYEGDVIIVNGLADGWCWEVVSEDRYKEWNLSIKQAEVLATVDHLTRH